MTKFLSAGVLAALSILSACTDAPPDPRLAQLQQAHDQFTHQQRMTRHALDSLATTGPTQLQLPTAYLNKYYVMQPRFARASDSLLSLSKQLPSGQLTPVQQENITKWLKQQQLLLEVDESLRQRGFYLVKRLTLDYQSLGKSPK